MRKRNAVVSGAAAALLAVTGLAAPASAEVVRVVDGDDSAAAVDLLTARVAHAPRQVRVRTVHDNLLRQAIRAGQSITVFVDTDPDDAGPEYRLTGGLNRGTDYRLQRVDRWAGDGPTLTCRHRMEIDWRKDVVVVSFGRGCLGRPDTVRVAVRAGETSHEGREYVDWLIGRRQFTPWVAAA